MAFTVADLVARLTANTSEFSAGMAKSSAELKGFAAQAEASSAKAATSFASGSKVLMLAGAAAGAAILASAEAFSRWGNQVLSVQRVTGGTAEEMSALVSVGHELGVSTQQMNVGFGLMAKSIANNATNFLKYGIAVRDAKGNQLAFGTILGEAADKFQALGGGLAGTAFAMNVFGRSGKTLIPILEQGSAGIAALEEHAKALGLVLNQDDVNAARNFAIAQRTLGEALQGLGVTIGRDVLPMVSGFVNGLKGAIEFLRSLPVGVVSATLKFIALTGAVAGVIKIGGAFVHTWTAAAALIQKIAGANAALAASNAAVASSEILEEVATTSSTSALILQQVAVDGLAASQTRGAVVIGGYAGAQTKAAIATDTLTVSTDALNLSLVATGVAATGLAAKILAGLGGGLAMLPLAGLGIGDVPKPLPPFGTPGAKYTQPSFAGGTAAPGGGLAPAPTPFDPAKLIAQYGKLSGAITTFASVSGAATAHFAAVSGQNLSAVSTALAKLATDAKANGADVLGTLDAMKGAWKAWHDSLVSAFGGAQGAIADYVSSLKAGEQQTVGGLTGSLDAYMGKLKAWNAAYQVILQSGGKDARKFLQDSAANGLQSLDTLYAVAGATDNVRSHFLQMYDKANAATGSLASQIEQSLGGAFSKMIDLLTSIAVKMGAIPPPKIDPGPAVRGLGTVHRSATALRSDLARGLGPIRADGRPAQQTMGALVAGWHAAAGDVDSTPLHLTAEASQALAALEALRSALMASGFGLSGSGWVAQVEMLVRQVVVGPKQSFSIGDQMSGGPSQVRPAPSPSSLPPLPSLPTLPSTGGAGGGGGGGGGAAAQQTVETLGVSVAALKGLAAALSDAAQKVLEPAAHHAGEQTLSAFVSGMTSQASHLHDAIGKTITALQGAISQAVENAKAKNEALSKSFRTLKTDVVPALSEMARAVDAIGTHLAKLKAQLAGFKQNIVGAFSGLKDLGGTLTTKWSDYQQQLATYQLQLAQFQQDQLDFAQQVAGGDTGIAPIAPVAPVAPDFSKLIADQVAQATAFAADLMAAAKAGLSKGLLQQFAAQGPAADAMLKQLLANPALIAQLNSAAQTISEAAAQTADALGDRYFGHQIKQTAAKLADMRDHLQNFIDVLGSRLKDGTHEVSKALHALANTLGVLSGLHFPNLSGSGGGGGGGGGGGPGAPGGGTPWGGPWVPWEPPAPIPRPPSGPPWPGGESPPPGKPRSGDFVVAGGTFHFHGVEDVPGFMRKLQEAVQKDARANAGVGGFANKGR